MNVDKPFSQEGYSLMGAAFEVHRENGGGLTEEIYQESLAIEFGLRNLTFLPKEEVRVFYKGIELRKKYIPDFLVFSEIVVELKAVSELTTEHEGQVMNYMRIARKPVGYLVNFGPVREVQWKRFVLSEFVKCR